MFQDIPFDVQAGQPPFVIVEAQAGDRGPLAVLIDTGAAAPFDLLITPEAARRVGAVPVLAPPAGQAEVPPAQAAPVPTGIGDAQIVFRPQRLASLSLGPIRLSDVSAGVTTAVSELARQVGRPIDAIVGHRFLAGRIIAIDYGARRIDFSASPPRGQPIQFTLAPERPLTLVRATLNGKGPFLFALDTGASVTLIPPATAKAAGLEGGTQVALAGAGGEAGGGATLVRTRIVLEGYARDGRSVAIADVLEPIRAAAGAPIEGVLGADFLAGARITIDYRTHRLWIQGPRKRR